MIDIKRKLKAVLFQTFPLLYEIKLYSLSVEMEYWVRPDSNIYTFVCESKDFEFSSCD